MPKQTIFTTCDERSPEPPYYGCCLPTGHSGDHKAWGCSDSEILAQWAQALPDAVSEQAATDAYADEHAGEQPL